MRIDRSAEARLRDEGGGRFRIEGEVVFTTVMQLLADSRVQFAGREALEVDLGGVERINTAGLALIIEWLREGRREHRQIRILHPPPTLIALARICEAEEIIAPALATQPAP